MGKSKKRVITTPQFYFKRSINTLKAGLSRTNSKLKKNMKNLQKKQLKTKKNTRKKILKFKKKIRKFFVKKLKRICKQKKKIFKTIKKKEKKFSKGSYFFKLFLKKQKKKSKKKKKKTASDIGLCIQKIKKRLPRIAQKKQPSLFPKHQFNKKSYLKRFVAIVTNRENFKYYFSVLITGLIIGLAVFIYNFVFKDLPSAIDLTEKKQIVTTRILDRNGRLLYRIYKDENRTIVPLEEIPQDMINATVAIEDKDFYQHHGFSLKGISRAFLNNVKGDDLQGGSTITQQLVKNRLLSNQRTIRRKLRELLLAVLVEGMYSKNEILEMYLNEVPYGGSTYGVEEAAWKYFGKPAKDMTLGESSMLAGLPAAPSVYTPFGANPELSKRRQEEVLRRMVEDNFITIEDAYHARNQKLEFSKNIIDIKAPHFVMYVKKLLAERYGEDMLQQGGLEVRTTLDFNLQKQTEEIVTSEVERLTNLNVSNGAALVTNPQTGEILAMVGSKNYFDFENDGQVNVILRPRQPGSSIKPLTYALAFEEGQTPWTMIEDSPITYHIPGSEPYSPKNYDDKFHGRVTLRDALANSYNVPAVKTLAGLGVENLINKAEEMGISTWKDRQRFGLSLTLGAGEVLMTDLAKVYGAFANGGSSVELDPFLKITNYEGEVLYQNKCFYQPEECQTNQTLSPLTAYRINSVLADNRARTPAFGQFSILNIPDQEVAVKTGTTNDLRDNWTIGYTSDRLVGVWVGNNDNQSMSQIASGITGASPIWNQVMRLMLDENNPHQFLLPDGYQRVSICQTTGTLPCKGCPRVTEEIFKEEDIPKNNCNWQYFVKAEEQQATDRNREKIL